MKDKIQEIEERLNKAWALNDKEQFGQPVALKDIQNLLKLVKAYEGIMFTCGTECGASCSDHIKNMKQEVFEPKEPEGFNEAWV